jgi:hypothetical protein
MISCTLDTIYSMVQKTGTRGSARGGEGSQSTARLCVATDPTASNGPRIPANQCIRCWTFSHAMRGTTSEMPEERIESAQPGPQVDVHAIAAMPASGGLTVRCHSLLNIHSRRTAAACADVTLGQSYDAVSRMDVPPRFHCPALLSPVECNTASHIA